MSDDWSSDDEFLRAARGKCLQQSSFEYNFASSKLQNLIELLKLIAKNQRKVTSILGSNVCVMATHGVMAK